MWTCACVRVNEKIIINNNDDQDIYNVCVYITLSSKFRSTMPTKERYFCLFFKIRPSRIGRRGQQNILFKGLSIFCETT